MLANQFYEEVLL